MHYIGQTVDLVARLQKHDTQPSYTMAKAAGQYRPLARFFKLEVVAHAYTERAASIAERAAIWHFDTMWPTGYNKTFGHPAASKQVYWIRRHAGTL